MAGRGQGGIGAGYGRLSIQAHSWWLKEHCNGDGARPGRGYGRWTGTHSARQAEPGHGTAVLVRQGAAVQGAGARGWWLRVWLLVAQGGGLLEK